jgi:hypothetical protein
MEAELTFRALVTAVDDYGRYDADPLMLKAALFPRRTNVTPEHVATWLAELGDEGCVQIYTVDGVAYLWLTGWEKHRGNARRSAVSRFPAPPADSAVSPGNPRDYDPQLEDTPELLGDSGSFPEVSGASGIFPEIREIPGDPSENRESGIGNRESRVSGKERAAARSPAGRSAAAPAEWALEAAGSLRQSVERRCRGAPLPESLVSWARELERIRAPTEAVQEALRWYVAEARDGDRYLPECRSGRAFRAKYDQVLAARRRERLPEGPTKPGPKGAAYQPFKAAPREGGIANVGGAIKNLLRDAAEGR